jgi:flagellin
MSDLGSGKTVTQSYVNGYFDKTQRTFNLYSLDSAGNAYNGSITVGFDYDYAKSMTVELKTASGTALIATGTTTWTNNTGYAITITTGITDSTVLADGEVIASGATVTLSAGTTIPAGGATIAFGYSVPDFDSSKNTAAFFDISPAMGRSASLDTRLYDIDKFWDSSGNFLLAEPQKITLVQGNGAQTSITLDSNDTIFTMQAKLNNAIRDGLGQGTYVGKDLSHDFVKFVYNNEDTGFKDKTGYSVNGTFVIQSAIAGKAGEIRMIGDDRLIEAMSLANIRNSSENTFNIWHKDAHSTNPYDISPNATIAGNLLVGVIHPNVDVMFDSNASIKTIDSLNSATGYFMFQAEADQTKFHTTTVHLADNTLVFQIGANPNQDVNASIGDMSAIALGVNNVLLTDRDSATNALTRIDDAINRVSGERAKMGALQNRLEHTINNLGVASENLSAAESRIRDVDMAAEMMNMTKMQILAQAGTAMMAQANAMPQMVLRLLGG